MDRLIINSKYIRFDVSNNNKLNIKSNNIYNKLDKETKINIKSNNIYSKLNKENKLPNDWIELIDPISRKKYYSCKTTKHTQWLNPTIPIGRMMSNGLPYGWDKEYDADSNRYYYINHVGRFNTWSPPIKQRSYLGQNFIW